MDLAVSLPLGWTETTLETVLPIQYGRGLVSKQRDESGSAPVYGSNGLVGHHSKALTHRPTIIIGRKGSAGSVYFSPQPCWPIDTAYFAEETPNHDLRFFHYLLTSLQLWRLDRSTAVPSLSRDDYNAQKVWLPPLSEQHRIVAEIERQFSLLDAGVANLKRVQANLKRYRAAVLQAACTGQLVPTEAETAQAEDRPYEPAAVLLTRILAERRARWEAEQLAKMEAQGKLPLSGAWRAKYQEPAAPDISRLPELPEGWTWTTVEQAASPEPASITDGPFGSNLKTEHYTATGPRVIRLQNIGDGVFVNAYVSSFMSL